MREPRGAELRRLIAIASGEEPADLLLRNARLINVLSGDTHPTDIAIAGPLVAGLGAGYAATDVIDLEGRIVCPGFIDAHVHLESAMVLPQEFARAVLPRGVTTVVADPHEIANVLGLDGIRFLLEQATRTPLTVFFNAPSCVPASELATGGAILEASDLAPLLEEPLVLGLGEFMDVPGILSRDERALAKIETFAPRPIDGHCPDLSGRPLNAYVAAGISSDHECTSPGEAREKLRRGITVFLRDGSAARNLKTLLPIVTPTSERRLCLCTDDRSPRDLLEEGSIDALVRMTIGAGTDPITAIRMATINPADHFGLRDRGALAPGRRADLVVFSNPRSPEPERVYKDGSLVAQNGKLLAATSISPIPSRFLHTVRIDWSAVDFRIAAAGEHIRAIRLLPGRLTTETAIVAARNHGGWAVADPRRDLIKMAVIERHHASDRVGLGFVIGIGLWRGALASTVAHDHHNLLVVGTDDRSMTVAARAVAEAGGGQAAAEGDRVLALLPLPIAGLMSDQPIERVREGQESLVRAAHSLGTVLADPFMAMSFLALEVIPSLKLTDRGLVDARHGMVVPLFAND